MINVIGLDLSLNSSGYAYRSDEVGRLPTITTGRIKPGKRRGMERLHFNRQKLGETVADAERRLDPEHVRPMPITLAVIEGYAMGYGGKGTPGRVFNIGEWGGVARLFLYDQDIPMLIVSPSSLKIFATGNGHAEKPEIVQAITELWGYDVPQDDEADAFVLMMLGEAYLSKRKARRYGPNRLRALEKVEYVDVPDLFDER